MIEDTAVTYHQELSENFKKNYSKEHFNERLFLFVKLVEKYVNRNANVIDLGCGPGIISVHISSIVGKVTGIDASENMIVLANQLKNESGTENCEFKLGDITELTAFKGNKIDSVISSSVLEYIPYINFTLSEISNLLNPGGIFIVSMPNPLSIYRQFEKVVFKFAGKPAYLKYSINHIRLTDFKNILNKSGFDLIESQYFAKKGLILKTLSKMFSEKYTNNMFVCVCRKINN
jgi:ubiquinone/menaquinone biosynthesis C-methylase UbiE